MEPSPWTAPKTSVASELVDDDDVVPWIDIWWRPGATMRFFLRKRIAPFVLPIAMVHGVLRWDFGGQLSGPAQWIANLVLGPFSGLLALALIAAWVRGVGALLEGRGSYSEVATAVAWGRLPMTLVGMIVFGAVLVIPSGDYDGVVEIALAGVALAGVLWGLVWQTITVAEAHRFGYFQAFVVVWSLPVLAMFAFLLFAVTLVSVLDP